MNLGKIAALRPGSPVELLADAMGSRWRALEPEHEGHVWQRDGGRSLPFTARVDAEGRLGMISFLKRFPSRFVIEGLHIGMDLAEARLARPGLQPMPAQEGELAGTLNYGEVTGDGVRLDVRFYDGRLGAVDLVRPEAVYPERPFKRADPRLTTAYDIWSMAQRPLPRSGRGAIWSQGWCHGLPPGITQAQWPISPANGHALRHAFTLHLPEAYRAQGPERVALSVFVDDPFELLETLDDAAGSGKASAHPHSHEMEDVVDVLYVMIWLTQAEFDAPLADPPPVAAALAGLPRPDWLDRAYADCTQFVAPRGSDGAGLALLSGDAASAGIGTAFPLQVSERNGDPNTGRPAREWAHQNELSGYIPAYSEAGKALQLERFYCPSAHLGGTMFPVQGYPDFSPYYLEFEENFGNFNFGGGAAQLDLAQMLFDWSC